MCFYTLYVYCIYLLSSSIWLIFCSPCPDNLASLEAIMIRAHIMEMFPPLSPWTRLYAPLVISTCRTVPTILKTTVVQVKGQGSSVIIILLILLLLQELLLHPVGQMRHLVQLDVAPKPTGTAALTTCTVLPLLLTVLLLLSIFRNLLLDIIKCK